MPSLAPSFVIIGNAGSGKSTLAAWLAHSLGLAVLDLDTVAWAPGSDAVPRDEALARADVAAFCARHPRWVVEGCYAQLVAPALAHGPHLVFLRPGLQACTDHARRRAWEPHKFASPAEQAAQLPALLAWMAGYETRDDALSLRAHEAAFAAYHGPKTLLTHVPQLDPPEALLQAWWRPGVGGSPPADTGT